MKGFEKYQKTYFMPSEATYDWEKKDSITEPPRSRLDFRLHPRRNTTFCVL